MPAKPQIICLERVLIAVADLERAIDRWRAAGFSVHPVIHAGNGMRSARFAAGAVALELCSATEPSAASGSLPARISEAATRGGGIIGWLWGIPDATAEKPKDLLAEIFTAVAATTSDSRARREALALAPNPNTVEYLDHIVVMVPELDSAVASFERTGLPCRRTREAGRGMRQAFFKLEDTVFEIVGPSPGPPRCWGLAFMCTDVSEAVALARRNGLQATEPKPAVQGGRIARIVDPLDGVAVAFMDKH